MENKVENINIEKNKELFEYEMTEVILRLKGEFAAFSGKDTKFAEMVVDDAKLRINTPDVIRVKVEGSHVDPPVIGCVKQTKTACIEVKETVLQLPVIPQMSDDDGRMEEEVVGSKKANIWQGIVVPDLHPFRKIVISKESSKKSLEETEREIVSSVEVPQLISVVERTDGLKKKKHIEPVMVHIPSTTIICNAWNKDKSTAKVEKRTLEKRVPDVEFDSLVMSDRVKSLSKAQGVDKKDIKIPHIVPNVSADIDTSKKIEAYMGEVPQIANAGDLVKVLPAISCESVQIKVPSMPYIGLHELRRHVVATSRKQIEFQETHGFKYEIKKPAVIRDMVAVPELKHIQTYKTDDVGITHQIITVPDTPKCNNIKKDVELKCMQSDVVLPNADISSTTNVKTIVVSGIDTVQVPNIPVVKKAYIPEIQEKDTAISVPYKTVKVDSGIPDIASEMSPFTVCVPTVSLKRYKPLSVGKVEQHNIEIPVATKPVFSGVALVEHEQSNTEIEIPPVKVNGNLRKVVVSHHEAIIIPQKPEVKETVDKIITLAVAKG